MLTKLAFRNIGKSLRDYAIYFLTLTEKEMLNKALFTQILCYFLIPLILAIIHSIVGLNVVYNLLSEFGNINVLSSIVATAAFVVVIYGAYFVLTYAGSKNIVKK